MTVTFDRTNKRVTLDLTDPEFNVMKHLYKVLGTNFLKLHLEKFLAERRANRDAQRATLVGNWFNSLTNQQKQAFLTQNNLTLDDE